MDRMEASTDKWGLHPISARSPEDETPGEASSRWICQGLPAQSRSGSSAGASERARLAPLGDADRRRAAGAVGRLRGHLVAPRAPAGRWRRRPSSSSLGAGALHGDLRRDWVADIRNAGASPCRPSCSRRPQLRSHARVPAGVRAVMLQPGHEVERPHCRIADESVDLVGTAWRSHGVCPAPGGHRAVAAPRGSARACARRPTSRPAPRARARSEERPSRRTAPCPSSHRRGRSQAYRGTRCRGRYATYTPGADPAADAHRGLELRGAGAGDHAPRAGRLERHLADAVPRRAGSMRPRPGRTANRGRCLGQRSPRRAAADSRSSLGESRVWAA